MKETFTLHLEDLPSFAKKVLDSAASLASSGATVLFLEGDLGAGKTTFTQALAKEMLVKEQVVSPTFILKKTYDTLHEQFKKLVHVDAYRFDTHSEGNVLRLENDITSPSTLLVIEWPSKLPYLQPHLTVSFEALEDQTRNVILSYKSYEKNC